MKSKKDKQFKNGAKFGNLTIICPCVHKHFEFICRCDCFQIVYCSAVELEKKYKTSCQNCVERKHVEKFTPGEIVIFHNPLEQIPFGAQAIVNRLIQNTKISALEVEYCGHFYNCRPSDVQSLGVKFYD